MSPSSSDRLSVTEVARRAGVTPATLKRWAKQGLLPEVTARDGWTAGAAAHARIIARLRERGHSIESIRDATQSGKLAFGYIEELMPSSSGDISIEDAARETGLEPALIDRIYTTLGFNSTAMQRISDDDLQLLRYIAAVLAAGFPLVALLQICRVYGQALAQIADAEVRLFHLYVHEPLMREGVPGLDMAEEMEVLARELLPLASPIMDHIHQRFLGHFVEQDVVGHMEAEVGDTSMELGRLKVAIAFADLAGYTRLTEEQGEEEAVGAVERFVEAVEHSLPEDARVIKTIGDEVMVVGVDPAALVDWAVGFQLIMNERPLPRIGIHYGEVLYRDGDYYGREVNLAARVAARSAGGEVIVTRTVVEVAGEHLELVRIGEVRLKGFTDPTELFLARPAEEAD
ncbi:MAG TPA: adenylate/guanylate cyclase domain-containing protein [Solirubrobacteraceae bacterium]